MFVPGSMRCQLLCVRSTLDSFAKESRTTANGKEGTHWRPEQQHYNSRSLLVMLVSSVIVRKAVVDKLLLG
jgi:hypothetical protein